MDKMLFKDLLVVLLLKCILIGILISGMKWLKLQEAERPEAVYQSRNPF